MAIHKSRVPVIVTRSQGTSHHHQVSGYQSSSPGLRVPVIITRSQGTSHHHQVSGYQSSSPGLRVPVIITRSQGTSHHHQVSVYQPSSPGLRVPAIITRSQGTSHHHQVSGSLGLIPLVYIRYRALFDPAESTHVPMPTCLPVMMLAGSTGMILSLYLVTCQRGEVGPPGL